MLQFQSLLSQHFSQLRYATPLNHTINSVCEKSFAESAVRLNANRPAMSRLSKEAFLSHFLMGFSGKASQFYQRNIRVEAGVDFCYRSNEC